MYSSCKIWKILLSNGSFIAFLTTYFVPKTTATLTFLLIFNEKNFSILSKYHMFWLNYESFSILCVCVCVCVCVLFFFIFILSKRGHPAKIAVLTLHKNYLNGIWKRATSPVIKSGTRLSFQGMLEVNLITCAKKQKKVLKSQKENTTVFDYYIIHGINSYPAPLL